MAHIDREELRTHVLLAFERYHISVKHLEIVPDGAEGGWRIGPAMVPLQNDVAIMEIAMQIEAELSAIYQLRRSH